MTVSRGVYKTMWLTYVRVCACVCLCVCVRLLRTQYARYDPPKWPTSTRRVGRAAGDREKKTHSYAAWGSYITSCTYYIRSRRPLRIPFFVASQQPRAAKNMNTDPPVFLFVLPPSPRPHALVRDVLFSRNFLLVEIPKPIFENSCCCKKKNKTKKTVSGRRSRAVRAYTTYTHTHTSFIYYAT